MIPKIIHYCWFGGNPLPTLALECIASWRKYLPDYEIWAWVDDAVKFNGYGLTVDGVYVADKVIEFDVNIIPYTAEAYKQKKYAFVSDYARFWAMYKYGGVYFDTDVEVIKPMDDIISRGNFMGIELDSVNGRYPTVALGLGFACKKDDVVMGKLLQYYEYLKFEILGGHLVTIVEHTTELLKKHGLKNSPGIQRICDYTIYPSEYFCPIHNVTKRLHITENTHSIHRYMDSWNDKSRKSWKENLRGYLPEWTLLLFNRIKKGKL